MQEYVITTQAELDALPEKFDIWTLIKIQNTKGRIVLRFHRENSSVVARENSSVEAWENSSVEAWENSSVVAWENSSVVARGNSSVVARENSSVVARENSSVEAWENSSVVAWENSSVVARENSSVVARENSSVVARENSSVVARGNSSVVARENSSVVARENSSVEAWENTIARILSAKKVCGHQYSVIVLQECEIAVEKDETCTVTMTKQARWDKAAFLRYFKLSPDADGYIPLVKITDQNGFDHHTGKIKYEGEVICPDWDASPERECGGGLHCSATEILARGYQSTGLMKIVKVHMDDFVVYPHNIDKVRCRRVVVQ